MQGHQQTAAGRKEGAHQLLAAAVEQGQGGGQALGRPRRVEALQAGLRAGAREHAVGIDFAAFDGDVARVVSDDVGDSLVPLDMAQKHGARGLLVAVNEQVAAPGIPVADDAKARRQPGRYARDAGKGSSRIAAPPRPAPGTPAGTGERQWGPGKLKHAPFGLASALSLRVFLVLRFLAGGLGVDRFGCGHGAHALARNRPYLFAPVKDFLLARQGSSGPPRTAFPN